MNGKVWMGSTIDVFATWERTGPSINVNFTGDRSSILSVIGITRGHCVCMCKQMKHEKCYFHKFASLNRVCYICLYVS
jgi:hypothetical protein